MLSFRTPEDRSCFLSLIYTIFKSLPLQVIRAHNGRDMGFSDRLMQRCWQVHTRVEVSMFVAISIIRNIHDGQRRPQPNRCW